MSKQGTTVQITSARAEMSESGDQLFSKTMKVFKPKDL